MIICSYKYQLESGYKWLSFTAQSVAAKIVLGRLYRSISDAINIAIERVAAATMFGKQVADTKTLRINLSIMGRSLKVPGYALHEGIRRDVINF